MPPQLKLDVNRANELMSLVADGLLNIKDADGTFLLRLDDGTVIDTKGWLHPDPTIISYEWTHGVFTTALAHSAGFPGSDKYVGIARDWFEIQYERTKGNGPPKNINTMAPCYAMACFIEDGNMPDKKWIGWCDAWAEWLMNGLPKTEEGGFQHMTYLCDNEQELWDDTLMMSVIPLAKIGMVLNRPAYVSEAIYQYLLNIRYLSDSTSGLWYHGWKFTPSPVEPIGSSKPASNGHNFAKALWARGNCWVTMAIPMLLEIIGDKLAPEDPAYRMIVQAWKRQVDALVRCQDPETGLWHTLLVDPTSYLETSASAGFVAGIYMGIRLGLISDPVYRQTADRGLAGAISQIAPDGEVQNVSYGTGMGKTFQFYKDIPLTSMPYGQALTMHALVEWQRLQGKK